MKGHFMVCLLHSVVYFVNYQLIEVQFATRRVAEKIEGRGLTLDDCIEILENFPYEIRSGTDSYGRISHLCQRTF